MEWSSSFVVEFKIGPIQTDPQKSLTSETRDDVFEFFDFADVDGGQDLDFSPSG